MRRSLCLCVSFCHTDIARSLTVGVVAIKGTASVSAEGDLGVEAGAPPPEPLLEPNLNQLVRKDAIDKGRYSAQCKQRERDRGRGRDNQRNTERDRKQTESEKKERQTHKKNRKEIFLCTSEVLLVSRPSSPRPHVAKQT